MSSEAVPEVGLGGGGEGEDPFLVTEATTADPGGLLEVGAASVQDCTSSGFYG